MPLSPALCQEGRARPADITSPPAGQEDGCLQVEKLLETAKKKKKSKCPLPPCSALPPAGSGRCAGVKPGSGEGALVGARSAAVGEESGADLRARTPRGECEPVWEGGMAAAAPPARTGREAGGPSAEQDGGGPLRFPPPQRLIPRTANARRSAARRWGAVVFHRRERGCSAAARESRAES